MLLILDHLIKIYFDHYIEYKKIKDTNEWDRLKDDLDLKYDYNSKIWFTEYNDIKLNKLITDYKQLLGISPIVIKRDIDKEIKKQLYIRDLNIQKTVFNNLIYDNKFYDKYKNIIEKFKTEIPEYSRLIDKHCSYLKPFQKVGVIKSFFNLKHFGGSIIAYDMGLGKTAMSIATASLCKEFLDTTHIIFVTLSSVIDGFGDEIDKFDKSLSATKVLKGVSQYQKKVEGQRKHVRLSFLEYLDEQPNKTLVTNYENIIAIYNKNRFFDNNFKNNNILFVFDEASKFKNSNRTYYKVFSDIIKKLEENNNTVYKLLLTGTPYVNDLKDFYNLIKFTLNEKFNDKGFYKNFVIGDFRYYHKKKQFMPVANTNLLTFNKVVHQFYVRKTIKTIKDQLPEKIELNRFIESDILQEQLMELLEIVFDKYIKDKNLKNLINERELRRMITSLYKIIASDPVAIKHTTNSKILGYAKKHYNIDFQGLIPNNYVSNKMKELDSLLEEIDINDNKVLIFTQWTTMQTVINNHIKKKFKIEPMLIYGGISNEDRSKLIKDFKESDKSEILIGTDAMAYGVNLPDIDYLIEYDIPWNPSQRAQRTNRIYRLSSTNRKIIVDLINEFEKPVYNVIKRKSTEFQTVVDGKDIEEIENNKIDLDENFSLLKKLLKMEVL